MTEALGDRVLALAAQVERELVVCAPFIKAHALGRLVDVVVEEASVEVFTRWRPDEVAAGVSDLEILEMVESRGGAVRLCDRLHAKYIRADGRAAVGSANVTGKALGWSTSPNLELLVEIGSSAPDLVDLEQSLRKESIVATESIKRQVASAAELMPRAQHVEAEGAVDGETMAEAAWYPRLREPFDLFNAYAEGPEVLSRVSADAASRDLVALDVGPGLDREAFEAVVGTRLAQMPVVWNLDALLAAPQRFGAVRERLGSSLGLDRNAAEAAWQTLMRWLLHFLPDAYRREVHSHTEMMVRLDPNGPQR